MQNRPGARTVKAVFVALALLSSSITLAGPLNVPNTFVPGQPAKAASVKQDFIAVETAVVVNELVPVSHDAPGTVGIGEIR